MTEGGVLDKDEEDDLLVQLHLSAGSNNVVQLHQPGVERKQLFVYGLPHNSADSPVISITLSVIHGGGKNLVYS